MNTENAEGREVAPERSGKPWVLPGEVSGLGYEFRDETLLRAALIPLERRSVAEEFTFLRLGSLGTRVLRFAASGYLYHRFEDETPQDLHLRLVDLGSLESRGKVARRLGLENFLLHGEVGTLTDSALVDCYKALAGAVFLDGGWEAAAEFIECSMSEELEQPPRPSLDAKTRLKEWCESRGLKLPIYEVLSQSASGKERVFHVKVRIEEPPEAEARGSGSSHLKAEYAAAEKLLEQLPPPLPPRPPSATKRLNAWWGSRDLKPPIYETLAPSGSDDEPVFHVVVRIEGLPQHEAEGSGSSRRKAMQAAAEKLLEQLPNLPHKPWVLPSDIPHLGYDFSEPSLLRAALIPPVRRSFVEAFRFQRLEFLGDQVLGFAVMARLYRQFKDETAGDLGSRHLALVSNETWRKVALRLGLERFVDYDGGGQPTTATSAQKALADCYEAVAGAIYLDGGAQALLALMEFSLREELENQPSRPPISAKTQLNSWCVSRRFRYPIYKVLDQSAPGEESMFHVEVRIEGLPEAEARGSGSSIKSAERAATEKLLEKLDADTSN